LLYNERSVKTDTKIDKLEAKVDTLVLGVRKDMEALGNKLIIRLTLAMLSVLGVAGTIAGFALRAMMMK